MTAKTLISINGVVRDIDELTLPTERTFRDAWQLNGDVVTIDTAAAAAIQRDRISAEAERRRNLLASPNQQLEMLMKATILNSVPEADRDADHAAQSAALLSAQSGFATINQKQQELEALSDDELISLVVEADTTWA